METEKKWSDDFGYKAELYNVMKYSISSLDKLIHYSKCNKDNTDIQKCINICFNKIQEIKKELEI